MTRSLFGLVILVELDREEGPQASSDRSSDRPAGFKAEKMKQQRCKSTGKSSANDDDDHGFHDEIRFLYEHC